MSTAGFIYYGIAHAIFAFDLYLELTGQKTITDQIFNLDFPSWIPYALSLVGFNVAFWLGGPEVSALFLGAWLLGHFSP